MFKLVSILSIAVLFFGIQPCSFAQSDGTAASDPLVLSNYIAWWAHDDRGYHPAVTFMYQNESGEELSDQLIRFQARFTEIKNNYLSVTRNDIRPILQKGEQRTDTLIGSEPYELSIDVHSWPQIECKVLYKIGEEADAHQLLLARVEAVTMTNEEAQQRILSQASPRRLKNKSVRRKRKQEPESAAAQPSEAPLAATALPLSPQNNSPTQAQTKNAHQAAVFSNVKKNEAPLSLKNIAGLADDFFDFEQAFGRPTTYDPSAGKWTWAKYQPPGELEIYAGARQPTSKADLVVALYRTKHPASEAQLIALAKALAGKYKSQPLGSPIRTVRYLTAGRVQLTNLVASSYRSTIYSSSAASDDNRYYLVLSRLPGSLEAILTDQAKHSRLLKFMQPVLGDSAD
jgi:hypothetical protein